MSNYGILECSICKEKTMTLIPLHKPYEKLEMCVWCFKQMLQYIDISKRPEYPYKEENK